MLATHWIGKARLAEDTNAAYQLEIWNLPESARLGTQTLDKLGRALPGILGAAGEETNQLSRLIRPLLDDLVHAESFTELREVADGAAEFALAIRLSAERGALWETNLVAIPGVRLARAGNWTVLGVRKAKLLESGRPSRSSASLPSPDQNTLFADFQKRFSSSEPTVPETNAPWLHVEANLSRLLRSNTLFPAGKLPFVLLTLAGEGQTVRTRAELTFPHPLEIERPPWQVPTNLIFDPLVSFTAMRGVGSLIESVSSWSSLGGGDAPNQVYLWALERVPFQTYFAAHWPDSSNRFDVLEARIMAELNPLLSTNGWGEISRMSNAQGVVFSGTPFFQPFLRRDLDGEKQTELVVGGFFPLLLRGRPIPEALLAQFVPQTNLLYYHWEITGERTLGWLHLGQSLRLVAGRAQLGFESAGLKWLQSMHPKLGNAATVVQQVDAQTLVLSRTSSAGLTGVELHLLVDWLESPAFPRGHHTSLAPARPVGRRKPAVPALLAATNGPPGQTVKQP